MSPGIQGNMRENSDYDREDIKCNGKRGAGQGYFILKIQEVWAN
jgi:hypothetical protein